MVLIDLDFNTSYRLDRRTIHVLKAAMKTGVTRDLSGEPLARIEPLVVAGLLKPVLAPRKSHVAKV